MGIHRQVAEAESQRDLVVGLHSEEGAVQGGSGEGDRMPKWNSGGIDLRLLHSGAGVVV
jgi:hypothetical protein